ncbi:hypothetical protein CLOM_g10929 [Closterium sp. NIES-68]|nr:hypothetical protein CLOM_g10929 [Closterium sp. NIES-68]GJP57793.1 hypothetical protein CLOP_g17386 [Closterium sp. NIES-67]
MAAQHVAQLSPPAIPATPTYQRQAFLRLRFPGAALAGGSAGQERVSSKAVRTRLSPIVFSAAFKDVRSSPASPRPASVASRRWRVVANARREGESEGDKENGDRSSEGSEKNAGSADGGAADGAPAGDAEMQQLLADLVQLQSDKVRVESFVEERSQLLTGIAESASAEYARIAEEAKRSMEEASSKVLQQVDAEADEFEQQLAAARADMERSEREFEEFEKSVEERRNSLLFFKQLYRRPSGDTPPAAAAPGFEPASSGSGGYKQGWDSSDDSSSSSFSLQPLSGSPPSSSSAALSGSSSHSSTSSSPALSPKEQALKAVPELVSANQRAAASPFRRKLYAALVALSGLSLAQAVTHEPKEWLQVAASGLVFCALLVQAVYERSLAAGGGDDGCENGGKE